MGTLPGDPSVWVCYKDQSMEGPSAQLFQKNGGLEKQEVVICGQDFNAQICDLCYSSLFNDVHENTQEGDQNN